MVYKNDILTDDETAISLQKFIDQRKNAGEEIKGPEPLILLNQTDMYGIVNDTSDFITISPHENDTGNTTTAQALYYLDTFYDPKIRNAPAYLRRYIKKMYQYKSFEEADQIIHTARNNKEALHIIGLIQLVGGCLNIARKQGTAPKLYIVEPETYMHPKRERLIITVFKELAEEYGIVSKAVYPITSKDIVT